MSDGNPLERARALGSVAEARNFYDDWAPQYDHDVFDAMGVTGSARVAQLLAEHVADRATPIVDLGCGTGAVGRHLAELGFDDVTGLDLSAGMLRIAERTGVYRELRVADLGRPPRFDDAFGASVSAGTFTTGHVDSDAVPFLLDLVRTGSILVWAIAPTLWPEFERSLTDGHITILRSATEPIRPNSGDRAQMVVGRLA